MDNGMEYDYYSICDETHDLKVISTTQSSFFFFNIEHKSFPFTLLDIFGRFIYIYFHDHVKIMELFQLNSISLGKG